MNNDLFKPGITGQRATTIFPNNNGSAQIRVQYYRFRIYIFHNVLHEHFQKRFGGTMYLFIILIFLNFTHTYNHHMAFVRPILWCTVYDIYLYVYYIYMYDVEENKLLCYAPPSCHDWIIDTGSKTYSSKVLGNIICVKE